MNLFNFLYLDGSDQEVGEAEAREMTSDEIADLRALPHKFSGESTRNVGAYIDNSFLIVSIID